MVLQALSNVNAEKPTKVISEETVKRAVLLSEYTLKHKLALIEEPTSTSTISPASLTKDDLLRDKDKIAKALTTSTVSARELSQKRLLQINSTADKSVAARRLITELARNGFGDIVEGRNNSMVLKRKLYDEMETETQTLFNELEVDKSVYERVVQADQAKKKK